MLLYIALQMKTKEKYARRSNIGFYIENCAAAM